MERLLTEAGIAPVAPAAAEVAPPLGSGTQAMPPGSAPVSAGSLPITQPDAVPAPAQAAQPQAPQYTPEQIATWQRQAQIGSQVINELQQLQAYNAQQQEEQQKTTRRQEAINAAELTAQNLPGEEGIKYVARATAQAYEAELAAERQRNQQVVHQQRQTFEQMLTPVYAQSEGERAGLRPEYIARLKTLPSGHHVDAYLPQIVQEQAAVMRMEEELAKVRSQIDQSNRSTQAQQFVNSGIHQPSGVGSEPVAGSPGGPAKGSREHLMSKVGGMFGYAPTPLQGSGT